MSGTVISGTATARLDAAFGRGEVGADGQVDVVSPEEKEALSRQTAMLRGRTWLGREMLTWLLFRSNSTTPVCQCQGEDVTVTALGPVTLKSAFGDVSEVKVKGNGAAYSKTVRRSLSDGLLVHALQLKVECGETIYVLTLDAEFFDLKGLQLPKTALDDEASKLSLRLEQVQQVGEALESAMAVFAKLRAGKKWSSEVAEMREWMLG